ncbi:Acetyltransferase (GNAT) domain-containing protein [Asanoa hainanensis]|uniref:Acetyltransferase (GNAT) domain-containing protein n=1 Tax=Asanoa hainanensis TaxID=560556 RepID=A0A239PG48_9ACTN|nr:GNAT family N-acetyltransferase [Asanoa hainanensis]SNT66041.1 Acetyltransferase (GNAT) domain-containing protein [Asanoa hainanensis]
MELRTSRLLLRELTDADHAAVHRYASDPDVTRFMAWGPNSVEETVAFLADARRVPPTSCRRSACGARATCATTCGSAGNGGTA